MDAKTAVKTAYEYLLQVSPDASQLSNFRVEEVSLDETKENYLITLSYEIPGEFGFDKKKEYKEFKVLANGVVEYMRIRKL